MAKSRRKWEVMMRAEGSLRWTKMLDGSWVPQIVA